MQNMFVKIYAKCEIWWILWREVGARCGMDLLKIEKIVLLMRSVLLELSLEVSQKPMFW